MGRTLGVDEGEFAGEGGASVPGDQATVWLHEGALPVSCEECIAGVDTVRTVELVDVTPAIVAGDGRVAPVIR